MTRCCAWPHRIHNRANQGNRERDCGYGVKRPGGCWRVADLRETEPLAGRAPYPGELTEDDLREMSALGAVPVTEEEEGQAVQEKKLISGNLAEGCQLFKAAFDCFYATSLSTMWTLQLKRTMEEGLAPYKNIFWRHQKANTAERNYKCIFGKVTSALASPASSSTSTSDDSKTIPSTSCSSNDSTWIGGWRPLWLTST